MGANKIITQHKEENTKSSTTVSNGTENTYRRNLQINSTNNKTTVNLSGYYHTNRRDIPFDYILDSVQQYGKTWIKNGTTKNYFDHDGKYMNLSLAHNGFYATASGYSEFAKELAKLKQGKGSVQFPVNEPLPLNLITWIVEFRCKENLHKTSLQNKKPHSNSSWEHTFKFSVLYPFF